MLKAFQKVQRTAAQKVTEWIQTGMVTFHRAGTNRSLTLSLGLLQTAQQLSANATSSTSSRDRAVGNLSLLKAAHRRCKKIFDLARDRKVVVQMSLSR